MSFRETDDKYIAKTYKRFPVELVSGKGSIVKDVDGKEYIDLGSGIAVTSFGIADDEWVKAVSEQAGRLQHTSNLYYSEPCAKLAEMLCEKTGFKRVFFSNSGAEANECAIKAARKYAAEKKGEDCYRIVTLVNSFHGRTITTLAATGQDHFHELFQPLTPGFLYCPAGDTETLKKIVSENKIAAFMFEMVQGEGGVVPLDREFVKEMVKIARNEDIILVVDEVQTGNGRTGTLYAYEQYGFMPDIVSTAKGLAGGLPLGATLLGEKVQDVYSYGDHGSTFGGNPVSASGAISVLSRIDYKLLADVKEKSDYIFETVEKCKNVESISGLGLMIGIKCKKPCGDVIAACREKGVLVISAKDRVRLLPALNIPFDVLRKAIAVLCEVIDA